MTTPNNAAALERIEKIADWLESFSDNGRYHSIAGPSSGRAFDAAQDLRLSLATLAQPDALTSQPSGEAVAWRFLDEDGKPTSRWADIDEEPMHYRQGKLRAGPYPGTSIQYAQLQPQDHNDNGKGRDNQRQPQGTTSGGSPDYSRPSHPSADAPGVAVDEWLPIESAPKDKGQSRMLLAWADGTVEQGMFLKNETWQGFRPESLRPWPNGQPTHWRPLPAPPAALAPKPEGGHG